jgi:hypothetical protein
VVDDKKVRVANYHKGTIDNFVEMIGASGLDNINELTRSHIYRRISLNQMLTYEEIFPSIQLGAMLDENTIPEKYKMDFAMSDMNHWGIKKMN